ncbi:hypothetical protein AD936_12745 [Gluconobacter japonicus]|nr:hypothetical protein AD936_12745 [Gluconobacter japonicus]
MVLGDDFHFASEARAGSVIALFLNCAADLLQKQKAAHLINDIGPAYPHGDMSDTHCPDKQSRLCFVFNKDMLDTGPNDRFSSI